MRLSTVLFASVIVAAPFVARAADNWDASAEKA